MKSYTLSKILSPKEQREFEHYLKRHRRSLLLVVFQRLCKQAKRGQEPSKEVLFKLAFDKPYEKEEDYKLRHELRLLNQELELFLAKIQEQKVPESVEPLYLLELLAERGAWDLWDKSWNRALKQSQKESHYEQQRKLLEMAFKVRHQRDEINADFLKEMEDLLALTAEQQLKDTGEQLLDLRIRLSYTEVNLHYFNPDFKAALPDTYLAPEHFEDEPLHRYLDLQAQMYFLEGTDKIEVLQQALTLQDEVEAIRPRYKKSRHLLLGTIAMEYSMQRQWQAADEAYQQMRPFFMEKKDLNNAMQVYNYMINTLYLGHYQEVLELHRAYSELITTGHKLYYRYLYAACWAHIFLGENEKGLRLILHDNLQQRSDFDNYYARLQYAILYYQMNEWEQCERELLNMQQRMRYKKQELNKLFAPQVEGIRGLLRIKWSSASKKEKQDELHALIKEIAPQIPPASQADSLAWHWLKLEIKG